MGAMGTTQPNQQPKNFSLLNPSSWLPQTGAEPTGDNNGTPEGDKALANGMLPVPDVGIYPGMAGLKSLGDGFARAQAIQYNRGITERILGNQQGRFNADSAAFGTYMTPASRASQAAAPSPDAAPTARANLGMASPPPPAFPVNAARPDATPSVAGGNGPLGGVGLSVPQAPDQAFRAPETQTQDDVDFNVNPVTTTGPRGMAGPLLAATDPITAPETPVKSYVGDEAKMPLGAGGSTPTPPIQRDVIPTAGSGNVPTPESAAAWFNKPASPQPQQQPQQAAPTPRQAPAAPQADPRLDMIAAEKERLQPMFRNPGTRAFALQRLQDLEQREYQINDPANQEKIALQRAQLEKTQLDIATAKNTPGVIGTDASGNPIHGFIDPINKTATPFQFSSQNAGQDYLTGEDYLKTLPMSEANRFRAMNDGRISVPANPRTPQQLAQQRMLMQAYPDMDATKFAARNAMRKDMEGGGKHYNTTEALGTVAGHLHDFADAADGLGGVENMGVLNYPLNAARGMYQAASQDPAVAKFNVTKLAVTDELGNAYRGGHITEGEAQSWRHQLSSTSSPAELRTIIGQVNHLLESKIKSTEDQYHAVMGKQSQMPDEYTIINNRSRGLFDDVTRWAKGEKLTSDNNQSNNPVSGGASSPKKVSSPDEAAKLPSGTVFQTPDGKTRRVP